MIIFLISTNLLSSANASLNDLAVIQELDNFVVKSLETFAFETLEPESLQVLCNIFFAAFEYARLDLEYCINKRMLIAELSKHNAEFSPKVHQTLKTLNEYGVNRTKALKRWDHVANYINENETLSQLFTSIAQQRLEFLNLLVENNYTEFSDLLKTINSEFDTSKQKIDLIMSFLQAACDKKLPFDYNESYPHLKEIDIMSNISLHIHNEIDLLTRSILNFEQYNDSFLMVCALLDMIYYNKLRAILVKRAPSDKQQIILFNENGLVQQDEAVELLPYVLN